MKSFGWIISLLLLCTFWQCSEKAASDTSLVFLNGKIWTGDSDQPWAEWVSVEGEYITGVGKSGERPPSTSKTIDLAGGLLLPGLMIHTSISPQQGLYFWASIFPMFMTRSLYKKRYQRPRSDYQTEVGSPGEIGAHMKHGE